ncbi:MAG TPA: hypothetical protein DIU15_20225 [Deltaproteobacteria bacterium]|nr:hypothetical protein [Deltaproteobacteria bacterium]HCP48376.1 hypothetical protein [Deltaproteobacteria bacterium]|tara:strand:- start:12 stop:452 length:441 start_codon:yes stop_codon:yes gene_type:complete
MTPRSIAFATVLLTLLAVPLSGCSTNNKRCQEVCVEFMNDCGWTAWENLAQCQSGCLDDTYRRDDADELLDCYSSAVATPSLSEAEAVVERSIASGVFAAEQAAGTFDRDAAVQAAIEQGTCDAFALVQCRADAVKRRPTGLFIQP